MQRSQGGNVDWRQCFGEVKNRCHEDAGRVLEAPGGRTDGVVVLNAKSDGNGEIRVEMSTGGGHFRQVYKLWHKDANCVQEAPLGRTN